MRLFKEYNNIIINSYYEKEFYKKIFLIFEGKGGNQIITRDILPKNSKIRDILVLSSEIEHGLNNISSQFRELQQNESQYSSSLFYFCQYGGSKTQFLHLIENELWDLPNCIIIQLENLTDINPKSLFEKILSQTLLKLIHIPKFVNQPSLFRDFFSRFNQKLGNIHISLNQSHNLAKAEELIKYLYTTKNPQTRDILDQLNELLHSTILVDSLEILNDIIDLMKFCSQNDLIFLFMFDEVDLWLDTNNNELGFSQSFSFKQNFMKNLLEIPDKEIKTIFLFASTARVNKLLSTNQALFENKSPAASRLLRIYNNAEKIVEPGCYGESIDKILVKLAAYFTIFNESKKVDEKFFDQTLNPLMAKYNIYSRRNCNSKIIQLLKHYQILEKPLDYGLKNWTQNVQLYGKLFEDNLQIILNRLNIKFIRENILIDPLKQQSQDKIDGYFVNYDFDNNEIKTYAEIKVTKDFKGDKAYQVLQWLQIHPKDEIVMIIASPTPLENIKKEINFYLEKENYQKELLGRLNFIHISNPYAFVALTGLSQVQSNNEKYFQFLESFANWLDFYGNLTEQYQAFKQKLGLDIISIPKEDHRQEEKTKKGEIPVSEEKEPSFKPLSVEDKTSLSLLIALYVEKAYTPSGKMNKSKIGRIIEKRSLGITNLENILENIQKANIILKITPKQVSFDKKIISMLSIDKFNEKVTALMTRKGNHSGINSFF